MKISTVKIRHVFLPYLLSAVGSFAFCIALRWVVDIEYNLFPLKDDIWNFWLSIAFPWVPILLYLHKPLRILNVAGKRDNGHFLYQIIICLGIAVPIIIGQNYIEQAAFDLNIVDRIQDVNSLKGEKYVKIHVYDVNENAGLPYITSRITGKNSQYLNFAAYMSVPFHESDHIWFGLDYGEQMSAGASDEEKDAVFESFIDDAEDDYSNYNFRDVTYFEILGYSDQRDGFVRAITDGIPDTDEESHIILVPRTDRFEDRLGDSFSWIIKTFLFAAMVVFFMTVIPGIDKTALNDLQKNRPLKDDDLRDMIQYLNPLGNHPVMATLILLNVAVYLVMILSGINVVSPTAQELLEFGGNRRYEVEHGEYWRLLTSMFVHSGIMHLVYNIVGMVIGATFLDGFMKKWELATGYFVAGIAGSLASIIWNENTVSVGASGAIFGFYGLILAFIVLKVYPKESRAFMWGFLGLFAGVSLLFGFIGSIDNAAHLGGLAGGFLFGILLAMLHGDDLKRRGID